MTDETTTEPVPAEPVEYSDANPTLDAHEDRWAWRARLRRNRATQLAWRAAVAVVGGTVTVAGLILVPAPGPGWLVVFFGLMILASEFEFAQRTLELARRLVGRWNDWVMGQPPWVRGLVALAALLLVWVLFWMLFALWGVPSFVPTWAADVLRQLPGVG